MNIILISQLLIQLKIVLNRILICTSVLKISANSQIQATKVLHKQYETFIHRIL